MSPKKQLVHLHQHNVDQKYLFDHLKKQKLIEFNKKMMNMIHCADTNIHHKDLVALSSDLYESGFSCLDLMEWVKQSDESIMTEKEKSVVVIVFHKIKSEYRCEKLLLFYILDFIFLRQNKDLKNIGFM